LGYIQCFKELQLGMGWRGNAGDHPIGDFCTMALYIGEKFKGSFGFVAWPLPLRSMSVTL
jgi:hypothetical protein